MDTKTILKELQNKRITPEQAKIQLRQAQLKNDSIAIIGISGRYSNSNDMKEYWKNLSDGINCICEIPKTRWDMKKYYDPVIGKDGKIYCKNIGMIDNYEYFDPLFFEITPKDAENMDPKHRLFLEESYKAFEDAGYSNQQLNNMKCGVYLGIVESIANMNEGDISATGSSNAIAASRIAYYLNLKGPAIAIDTACSSSGVAVHLASQAIHNGEIDMALVGGVCLYLKPESYVSMCSTGMLSPTGQCKTFDNKADGFVPGEGVGALILKRLSDAERDHDHIYGCIIASGLNQDGKTNGITAPNLESQKELVASLYAKKQINPETITYAEFHGTGTKLGDPIELESLATAFSKSTKKKNYCAIGSVKSNLGHTSAAGTIASIQKILLCMQHKSLVPTINVNEPNEHFDFVHSPFYINKEKKEWSAIDGNPLRSCINSFGFSGTNVHVVIEEYKDGRRDAASANDSENLFVLSAKSEAQLKEYARRMLDFIKGNPVNFNDFFYTLQISREPMEERLAIVIKGRKDLIQKLSSYLANGLDGRWMFGKHLTKNEIRLREAAYLDDRKKQIEVYKKLNTTTYFEKLKVVAQQWIHGEIIDWAGILYHNDLPYKISIPTYPFNDKPYVAAATVEYAVDKVLHPLLQRNVSDFEKQCFQSTFSGDEFFIADHEVEGKHLLPGAAMVEMARIAGELSTNVKVTGLRELQWLSPVEVGQGGRIVDITLYPAEGKAIFEITTEDNKDIVCTQGELITQSVQKEPAVISYLELNEIQERCTDRLDGAVIYNHEDLGGILYGESFQGIKSILFNEREALAYLSLDASYNDSSYVIAPTLLDSAMQAVSPLIPSEGKQGTYVPYSMRQMQVFDRLPNEVYSYVAVKANQDANEKTFDITIADRNGKPILAINEFTLRHIGRMQMNTKEMVYLKPAWVEEKSFSSNVKAVLKSNEALLLIGKAQVFEEKIKKVLGVSSRKNVISIQYGEIFAKLGNSQYQIDPCSQSDYAEILQEIHRQGLNPSKIIMSSYKDDTTENRIKYSFETMVTISNALMNSSYKGEVSLLYCINGSNEDSALSGMFKGILKEVKRFRFKTIRMDAKMNNKEAITSLLWEFGMNRGYNEVYLKKGQRLVRRFEDTAIQEDSKEHMAKEGGVYLITGGLGGIGLAVAEHLSKTKNVHIILSGRRKVDTKVSEIIHGISSNHSDIIYLQADISKREDCNQLVESIKERYGKLDGVIQSAGIIKNTLLWDKCLEDAKAVLAPKIYGTMYLDEAIGGDALDYMMLCSSLASAIGNLGQCDYCYANSFMDYFAESRNELVAQGLRKGKTVSVNWCPWATSGMTVEDDFQKYIEEHIGLLALNASDGMGAFEDALKARLSQIMVFKGDAKLIHKAFLEDKKDDELNMAVEEKNLAYTLGRDEYREQIVKYLRNMISIQTKMSADSIDADESFGDYGIDSIVIINITRAMEKDFGNLSKTLFFEYNNLNKLTDYFVENHLDQFVSYVDAQKNDVATENSKQESAEVITRNRTRFQNCRTSGRTILEDSKQMPKVTDFAVIGISGRYPMADDLEEFWENLKSGRDCIREIPRERWDYQEYYNPDKNKVGKAYIKWGGFLNDVDKFDPLFFNIPPVEAEFMDPQVRLSLESAWHALEDAGYTREQLATFKVGVFIGVMYGSYQLYKGKIGDAYVPATSSYSAIANRISYFFDFHGPSLAVDTMCSSSLTALHLACESLRRGETDVAFVGGVNLSIHPDKYLTLSFGKFASSDGKCRSFGEGGDGYVPGEGVGTLIIKPLEQAEKDHDHIYAVIKGSAINSGGKASGFTVPSPVAQSEVMKDVYEKTGVDVDSVSYIETHGTGTSLGDPVEINGLSKVFGKDTNKKQYCSIGSVKSNIGHLEGAAGIASLTKVILQMQHNQLLPSLHSKKLNPYIDFENSPFYVQQELSDWKETVYEKDNVKVKAPRRAAISSFGAGGSNAHVLLEQYVSGHESVKKEFHETETQLYLFSAKTKERLEEYVKSFVSFLKGEDFCDAGDMEKTIIGILANGTGIPENEFDVDQSMEEYGLNLSNVTQLHNWMIQELELSLNLSDLGGIDTVHQLAQYLQEQGVGDKEPKFKEYDARNIAYILQTGREAMEERLAISADSLKELSRKLCAWLQGDGKGCIQHNVLDYKEHLKEMVGSATANKSLTELLEAKEYQVLADLWTKGVKIDWSVLYDADIPYKISLPVYPFEKESYWVKTKEEKATISSKKEHLHPLVHQNISNIYGILFRTKLCGEESFLIDHRVNGTKIVPGVVFLEMVRAAVSIAVGDLEEYEVVHIHNLVWMSPAVVADENLTIYIKFDIQSREEIEFTIYSEDGMETVYCTGTVIICEKAEVVPYDMKELSVESFTKNWETQQIYSYLKKIGLEYGASFQAIQYLSTDQKKVVAILGLEERYIEDGYCLILGIADSALQSAIAFQLSQDIEKEASGSPMLPFAVDEVNIIGPCGREMIAILEKDAAVGGNSSIEKINIDLYDTSGNLCVRIKGLATRRLPARIAEDDSQENLGKKERILFELEWMQEELILDNDVRRETERKIILFAPDVSYVSELKKDYKEGMVEFIARKDENIAETYTSSAELLLHTVKELYQKNYNREVLIQICIYGMNEQEHLLRGLSGFLKSMELENENMKGQLLIIDDDMDCAELTKCLDLEAFSNDRMVWRKENKRYMSRFNEVKISEKENLMPWKNQGIYLITGGFGGLGRLMASEIGDHLETGSLILVGRSEYTEASKEKMDILKKQGVTAEYIQADVSVKEDTFRLAEIIKEKYGRLDGVIHCAGVVKDNWIIRKTSEELRKVLKPKVTGLYNLDRAMNKFDLDFILLMSSSASVKGNLGQSDYAAANGFMDCFAEYRNQLMLRGERAGVTYSVNWPLWRDGGMQISTDVEAMIYENTGMVPLEKEDAFAMLYQMTEQNRYQFVPMQGTAEAIREWINPNA